MIIPEIVVKGCVVLTLLLGVVLMVLIIGGLWSSAMRLWVNASIRFRNILKGETLIVEYKHNKEEIDKYLVEHGLVKK